MKNHVKKIVSIALCICMFIGMAWNGGGLEALATSLNLSTNKVTDLQPKDPNAELGTPANPFTILEIVPEYSHAQIGYMIPGCEPLDIQTVGQEYEGYSQLSGNLGQQGVLDITETEVKDCYLEDIPYGAELNNNDQAAVNYVKNNRSDITVVSKNKGFGCWLVQDYNKHYIQGYYAKTTAGSGPFKQNADGSFSFAEVKGKQGEDHNIYEDAGCYQWIKQDFPSGISDGSKEDDKVWKIREVPYLFNYKTYVYKNNDIFIKHVYGKSSDNFQTQVITLTTEDLSDKKNQEWIKYADLITIHDSRAQTGIAKLWNVAHGLNESDGVYTTFANKDLGYDATMAIMERMSSDNPAAMVIDATATWDAGNETNVHKLFLMLMQYDPAIFMQWFGVKEGDHYKYLLRGANDKVVYQPEYKDTPITSWDNRTFQYSPTDSALSLVPLMRFDNVHSGAYNVVDHIYTYQGDKSMFQEFTGGSIGYHESNHNGYFQTTNVTEDAYYFYEHINGERPTTLKTLDALYYILRGQANYTERLRILEIQPCDEFIYGSKDWKVYYQSLFPWHNPKTDQNSWMDDPNLLQVDTMPIWEFIGSTGTYDYDWGKNKLLTCDSSDDLISKYDLIIIGANQNETNGKNGYNDGNLKQYIYTSVGDRVATSEHKNNNQSKESVLITSGARYSPIDLTLKKLLELQDFVAAGKPIVVDDGLYNNDGTKVNTDKVDVNSKIYEFLNGKNSNDSIFVHNHSSMSKMKNNLLKSLCRLELAEGGYPTEYVGNESSGVLVENYNPSSTLDFKFRIAADVTASKDTTYTVSLNIDKNGDGVYGDSLKQRSEVKNMKAATKDDTIQDDKKETAITDDKYLNIKSASGSVENGKLKANTWYEISYKLPSNQKGIIPWKLEVASTANEKLRSSAIDYTVIKCADKDKIRINVLQMNLTPDMSDATYQAYATYFTTNVVDIDRKQGVNSTSYKSDYAYTEHSKTLSYTLNEGQKHTVEQFDKYLKPVKEFNVHMQFMYNEDWKTMFATGNTDMDKQNWRNFLSKYDMLIFGFQDLEMFTSNEVFLDGLEDYIAQGKSVIFSHDMVMSAMNDEYGWQSKEYKDAMGKLRDIIGQRTEYYSLNDNVYTKKSNSSDYCDNALQLALRACSAYSGYYIYDGHPDAKKTLNSLPKLDRKSALAEPDYKGFYLGAGGLLATSFVKIANNGQITTYPYNIPDEIEVLQTHVQNYALNLEYLEDGDVNVWYNLTDSAGVDASKIATSGMPYNKTDVYSAKDGDCRNNFYIYNKGNITYTGMGHGRARNNVDYAYMTDDEIKLFINTMISAYRQPEGAPYAVIQNADATSGSSSIYYLDYDGDPNAVMDGKIVYENGVPCLKVQFTIEDDSTNPDADKKYYLYFLVDGEVKEYKVTGTGESLTVADVGMKNASGANGKGYEVPKAYIGSKDNKITVYIPYTDITSHNGQISMSLCTYATYPKNGKTVSTPHAKAEVTTMYLPLFDLN